MKVSDLTWYYASSSQYFHTSSLKGIIEVPALNDVADIILNGYTPVDMHTGSLPKSLDKVIGVNVRASGQGGRIELRDYTYTSVNDWLADNGNKTLYYKEATS